MAPSPTIRRLLKETAELSDASPNPNPAFYAAPVSDSDLYEWHFTLLGPPSPSPYAGGLYHGRITLPPSYPLKPPNFRFLTPSGRFEVNREICLSISGFHEETWMPAWGVRTALTALRSFMAEAGTAGQVGGLESSRDVRLRLAKESRRWRCESCGKANDEIMGEWWRVCVDKGIKVEEEHMGLEALPEGMAVEARSPGLDKGKQKEKTEQQESPPVTVPVAEPSAQSLIPHTTAPASRPPEFNARLPGAESEFQQRLPSSVIPQASQTPTPTTVTSPQSRAYRQIPAMADQNDETANITIDRAIYVVFLALCLMILKKIFYPASSGGLAYDDLKMLRE